jgi:hypothetical protein
LLHGLINRGLAILANAMRTFIIPLNADTYGFIALRADEHHI